MMARPIFRPIWCLRAACRMTASLTGNTAPARSRAILYVGQSVIIIDFGARLAVPLRFEGDGRSKSTLRKTV